jgi:hypothetical protein
MDKVTQMRHTWAWASTTLLVAVPVCGATVPSVRPPLAVAAPAFSCPTIAGSFVVLLSRERGMLLLSSADFPGARKVGEAAGGAVRVTLPRSGGWDLARAGSPAGTVPLWASAYRVKIDTAGGCVSFDRDRFSSEGDVVTYVQWLVNDVYNRLPQAERDRFPALRLASRIVHLRVVPAGYQPVALHDTEGATMALHVPGTQQTLLLRPIVLDEATARVAIDLAITDQPYFQAAEKRSLGLLVATPAQSATLADPAMTILVDAVLPAAVPTPAAP